MGHVHELTQKHELTQHEGGVHLKQALLGGELVEQGAHDGGASGIGVQEQGVQIG